MPAHVRLPFAAEHSNVLAVCCSDGRYIRALEAFLSGRGIDGHDLMAFPGGPGRLCRESASYTDASVFLDATDYLLRSHKTQRVVLVAHADCGYYKSFFGRAERARQEEDLRRIAGRLRDKTRALEVSLVFVSPNPDKKAGGFVFEDVEP